MPEFFDETNEDDDRAQEIGNMMSYGISQGLSEEQVVECYKQAFVAVHEEDTTSTPEVPMTQHRPEDHR